jgi:hypothetical protein
VYSYRRLLHLCTVLGAFFLVSCGGLFTSLGEGGNYGVESLIAKPARTVYGVGDSFNSEDLRVYAIYAAGDIREIALDQVRLTGAGTYNAAGTQTITAEYGGKTDSYTITVGSTGEGEGGGGWGGSGDNGGGIFIIWSS